MLDPNRREQAMERRDFLGATLAGGMLFGSGPIRSDSMQADEIIVERDTPGNPYDGKVLAAIQPHSDDIPIFAAGTVAKLIKEGYTGYLIRTTNDECAGPGSVGDTVLANEKDNLEVARVLGLKKVFDLNYRNHRMDGISALEYRARLIFLFRLLKVDTVICYDPWGHYEENPDHTITAQGVEAACWMAAMSKDYPEHFDAGLEPHAVREKYYFARGPQLVNRVVDISSVIEKKVDVLLANRAQGPAGEAGMRLRKSLAERNLKLPLLGDDDTAANRSYIKQFVLQSNAELGRKYGLEYAEAYHYIGSTPSPVEAYVKQYAVPLR